MNQQTLKAYLNLIQGLLSCPQGEEWILLRQNEELVNPELVGVMEQVANHLALEGNIKAAKYLHNWAGKLHHILTDTVSPPQNNQDQTQAYLELIQALLNSPKGSQEQILASHQDLIGPELVKVMKQVANQIAGEGNQAEADWLNNLAIDLNRTWLKNHEFQPTLKKEVTADPWLDSDSAPAYSAERETQPIENEVPTTAELEEELEEESVSSSPLAQFEPQGQLAQQLQAIADSLVKLETILASRLQASNPLWYMEILEKAEASNWILTTDEVEQLIGIKPLCHHDETSYQRGSWIFMKAGKIGPQTGWRVQKSSL
jgi:hypothetical protein